MMNRLSDKSRDGAVNQIMNVKIHNCVRVSATRDNRILPIKGDDAMELVMAHVLKENEDHVKQIKAVCPLRDRLWPVSFKETCQMSQF